MPIVELDPILAWKAIEGYTNELDPDAKRLEALYRQLVCPRCGGPWQKEFKVRGHAFQDPDSLVPRALLRCRLCDCLFNPHVLDKNGVPMILQLGNPARIPPDVPLIDP